MTPDIKTRRPRRVPSPDAILEQLEFEISALDQEAFPLRAASFLIDGQGALLEFDQAASTTLGISGEGPRSLDHCARLSATQKKTLRAAIAALLAKDAATEQSFLRFEFAGAGKREAICLTLTVRKSDDGRKEVACQIEPILAVQPDSGPLLTKPDQSSIQLWSMDAQTLAFTPILPPPQARRNGHAPKPIALDQWVGRICEGDKALFRDAFLDFVEGAAEHFHLRYRLKQDTGELKWVSTIARREIENSPSAPTRIIGLHRDESEIPNVSNDLQLFSYLAKKVSLSILVTDADGRIAWCNNAFTEITGYALPEISNRTPGSVLQGELSDPETIAYMRERRRRGKAFHAELINYKKNGAPYWARIDANPLVDEDGKVVRYIAFLTDITESKKTQSAILRNEIKFRSLFDHSFDALLLLSPKDGMIIEANRAAIRFFDTTRLVGHKLEDIFPGSALFTVDQLNELVDKADGSRRETSEFVAKDGRRRPIELTVHRTPIGEAIALFVTLRDISEKRLLEEQLRHAQRMEAVGRLAGGIAHDFNNLLAGLRGFTELLCNSRELSKKDHVYAHEILKIADRSSKLTSRLLSFSRGKSEQPVAANLNSIVGNITPMLSRILKKDIQFTSKLDPRLGNVKVDPGQIEQVVMNLVVNGQEAIAGPDGVVTLNTGSVELDGTEIFVTGKPKPGHYAMVSVQDNGHGIPQRTIEKIFEPFFTTKKGAGTGLGLSIVYGIIKSNGGHLKVESAVGAGTEFAFYFPIVSEEVIAIQATDHRARMPSASSANGSAPTILIAEDQEQVREILELGLGQSGYRLLIASDGKEAIELARKHCGVIDLLLTDSIMPRVSGCQVVREVRQLYPEARVIMMSGLPQQESEDCANIEVDAYVDKPFSIRKLIELIEAMLSAAREAV